MANIILSDDYGEYIEVDEVAYVRVGAVLGTPANATVGAGDHLNVEAYEWTYDADNVLGGTNHRTWTAAEHTVSLIDVHRGVVIAAYDDEECAMFTAPEDAEIKAWGNRSLGFKLFVNGLLTLDTSANTLQEDARAFRVAKGDVVTGKPGAQGYNIEWAICPDIYPY